MNLLTDALSKIADAQRAWDAVLSDANFIGACPPMHAALNAEAWVSAACRRAADGNGYGYAHASEVVLALRCLVARPHEEPEGGWGWEVPNEQQASELERLAKCAGPGESTKAFEAACARFARPKSQRMVR